MIGMTTEPTYPSGDPKQELSRSRELAHRVRATQRATWFPLLVFAAVTLAAIPVYRYGHHALTCRTIHPAAGPVGRVCLVYSTAGFVYWPIALVLAYVAITAFYLNWSRARGVGTRVLPYAVAGVVIAVVLTAASVWAAHHPPVGGRDILGLHLQARSWDEFYRLIGPACAIGFALLVLAWAERSRALLAVTVGYLVIVLAPVDLGWVIAHPSPWAFLPRLLIDGLVLLLAGVGFALAQLPAHRPEQP